MEKTNNKTTITTQKKVRIAAMSDIHVNEAKRGFYQPIFQQLSQEADIVVLGGDLTNYGLPEEAKVLAEELKSCTIPVLGVLGNHDHESDKQDEVRKIVRDAGLFFLDEQSYIHESVGFAGVKGFGGGFSSHMLAYFGEAETKAYAQVAIEEAKQLEIILGSLEHVAMRVVVMHYSPIADTLKGEPIEIYPFLGATRFEEVIDRFHVNVVIHGHAHYGSPEGKTGKGAFVYNVAFPLMQRMDEKKPYRIFEL